LRQQILARWSLDSEFHESCLHRILLEPFKLIRRKHPHKLPDLFVKERTGAWPAKTDNYVGFGFVRQHFVTNFLPPCGAAGTQVSARKARIIQAGRRPSTGQAKILRQTITKPHSAGLRAVRPQGAVAPAGPFPVKPPQRRGWPPGGPPAGSAPRAPARRCGSWQGGRPLPASRALIRGAWGALNEALLSFVLVIASYLAHPRRHRKICCRKRG